MLEGRRIVLLGAGLVLLAVALVVVMRRSSTPSSGEGVAPGTVYYTGPRRSKLDPNVWVNAEGKVVPAPAGAPRLPAGGSVGRGPN